jgi:hypothetical protein
MGAFLSCVLEIRSIEHSRSVRTVLRLFYSYSRKDAEWCDRLNAHLQGLSKLLEQAWYDRKMRPGDDWNQEITEHLDAADIIVLLVSSNYFGSVFCGLELERAMERHQKGEAAVIPVMLRQYNISEAAFARLNTCPPADQPIDSSAWADKELALKTVSEAIERVARERMGMGSKNQLLHPNREELGKLLYHLCDRGPQRDALYHALRPEYRKPRRPFVVIFRGRQQDSLEWFLNRLEAVILPWLLGMKPGRLSPLVWPNYDSSCSAAELFGPRLTDCLTVSPYASVREMNRVLAAHNSVNLLPSSLAASNWTNDGELLLESYLKLWEEWPRLTSDFALIPVLAIEYSTDSPLDDETSEWLSGAIFADRPKLAGVVLPPMGPVEHQDFKEWLQHEKVRTKFASPEKAVAKSNEMHGKTFPTPMHPLAEEYLPQFLERL